MFVKGQPKIAGRKPGTPNKVAASIKEICQKAAPALVEELLRLAKHSRSEMVRITAAKEILDRGFGKPKMSVESEVVLGVSLQLRQLLERHDGESRSIPPRTIELVPLNGADVSADDDGEKVH